MTLILTQNSLTHMLLGNTLYCRGLILSHCRNIEHCYNMPFNAKLKMQHGSRRNANPVFPLVHNSSLPITMGGTCLNQITTYLKSVKLMNCPWLTNHRQENPTAYFRAPPWLVSEDNGNIFPHMSNSQKKKSIHIQGLLENIHNSKKPGSVV